MATANLWCRSEDVLPGGVAAEGALRVLDGQIPYRDFWTMYAPGEFYAVAALFWIFGQEIIVQAVGVVLIIAASAAVFYLLTFQSGGTGSFFNIERVARKQNSRLARYQKHPLK